MPYGFYLRLGALFVGETEMTEKEKAELIEFARRVQNNSYAPYSNFHVGAAVQTESGKTFVGTNVENVSYGLTICAERVAVFNAISHGQSKIKAIAITSTSDKPVPPCGACRQVIKEFSTSDTVVIMAGKKILEIRTIDQLLPLSFAL